MARIGYGRVSSRDQHLDIQRSRLADCDKVFLEIGSGASDKRPQLQACLDYMRAQDVLVVTRLDRLARSVLHLHQIHQTLQQKQVELEVLDQHLETSTSTGRLMFGMLSIIAQFELELRAERQREGITKAHERGVHFGRTKRLTPEEADELRQLRADGVSVAALTRRYLMTRTSVYRYLAEARLTGVVVDAAAD
jgi:DNA invertase Pin-like site-specific DNA recombinase